MFVDDWGFTALRYLRWLENEGFDRQKSVEIVMPIAASTMAGGEFIRAVGSVVTKAHKDADKHFLRRGLLAIPTDLLQYTARVCLPLRPGAIARELKIYFLSQVPFWQNGESQ